jgi:hypothetical protein
MALFEFARVGSRVSGNYREEAIKEFCEEAAKQ